MRARLSFPATGNIKLGQRAGVDSAALAAMRKTSAMEERQLRWRAVCLKQIGIDLGTFPLDARAWLLAGQYLNYFVRLFVPWSSLFSSLISWYPEAPW